MSLVENILARRTPVHKRFRFTLSYGGTDTVIDIAPDGFANGQTKIVRNKTYRGLFRTLAVNELAFIGTGKDILKSLYDTDGVDADCLLKVDVLSSNTYFYYATLKLDFATYKIDGIGVKIQAVDDSYVEKLKNRDSTVINLLNTVSIDGDTISDFPKGLHFNDTNINNNAEWNRDANGNTDTRHILPITIITSDFTETKTPVNVPDSKDGACFYKSLTNRTLTFSGTVTGNINPIQTGTGNPEFNLVLDVYDKNGSKTAGYTLAYVYTTDNSGALAINTDFSKEVTINAGDSVVVQANWDVIGDDPNNYELVYQTTDVKVNETYLGTPAKTVAAFGIYEAFYRAIQLLTGKDSLFYSELFGRVDTPQQYTQDGYLLHLIKGRALRGTDNDFPVTFRDLFLSVNSLLNIGMGYENGKFVIERIDHFFDFTNQLDLSYLMTDYILEISAAPDLINKSIQIGYEKYGKDKDNSGYEYNTKMNFSTPVKSVTTSLNLVSKYRADSTTIIRLMNDPDLSKNDDGDNDLFFIKSYRDTDNVLKAKTGEGMTTVTGSTYAKKSYNLGLTPKRNLLNWGNIITVGLPTNSVIRKQHAEVNIDLCTQIQPDDDLICEDADINYVELTPPLFSAERYKFKVPLTFSQILTIFDNQNLKITLGDGRSGFIDTLTIDNDTNEAEFTLIKLT